MDKFLLLFGFAFLFQPTASQSQCNPAAAEIPKNGFDEDCDGLDDLFFVLPPYIYGVEGQDMEVYFRNLFLSKHPQDYQFSVATPLGGASDSQKWTLVPPQNSAGEHPISISIKSSGGQILATASSTIRISPDDSPADLQPKKLLLFGHSFFDQGYMPKYIWDLLQKPGNPPVSFHGKKVSWANSNARHEGYGGMMARWFFRDPSSPILYGNKVDFRRYFDETVCGGCAPDWIVFHLDINDFCGYSALAGTTLQEIDDTIIGDWNRHATRLVDEMRAVAPNAKIAICISPPPNARESSFAATYGGNPVLNNRWRWQKIINRLIFKNIERYGNRENQNIFLIPEYLDIDDFGEYNPPDARHPDPPDNNINTHCGYNEIAKAIYAWLRWAAHHPNGGGNPTLQNAFRDADGDGFGNPNDVVLANPIPAGRVAQAGDCDDSNPNRHPNAPELCNDLDDNCNAVADEETVPPVARCKANFELKILTGNQAALTAADLDDGSFDACNEITYSIDKQMFACSQAGKTEEVTLTVRDVFQNFSTCKTWVKITDATPPLAICKASLLLDLPPSGNLPIYDWQINDGSWDACGIINLQLDTHELTCDEIGETTVQLTATDAAGNSATCSTKILLEEKNQPTAICRPSLALDLPETGNLPIYDWQINDGSWDACGIVNLQLDTHELTCDEIGETTVQLTATDAAGNSATCSTKILLSEKNAPTARCKTSFFAPLDADGKFILSPALLDNGSFDDCGSTIFEASQVYFNCQNLGKNAVKLTVSDQRDNSAECWSQVEIVDFIAPNLPPPTVQNLDILLGTTGEREFDLTQNFAGAADNCQNFEWQTSVDGQFFQKFENLKFTCSDAALPQPRSFWVRLVDPSGNASLARKLDFWVSDNTPPVLTCREVEVDLPLGGEVVLSNDDLLEGASDECSPVDFLPFNDLKINCLDANSTVLAEIFGKDAAGNLSSCQAKIKVNPAADSDGDGSDDCSDDCPTNAATTTFFQFFKDTDGDGFGAGAAIFACDLTTNFSKTADDCDDSNPKINPAATEIWNGLDDDCDFEIDEGTISTGQPSSNFPKILLSPNPTDGLLRLSWSRSDEFLVEKILVFTAAGLPIFDFSTAQFFADQQILDVLNLPSGVYFLKIKFQAGGVAARTFVKI